MKTPVCASWMPPCPVCRTLTISTSDPSSAAACHLSDVELASWRLAFLATMIEQQDAFDRPFFRLWYCMISDVAFAFWFCLLYVVVYLSVECQNTRKQARPPIGVCPVGNVFPSTVILVQNLLDWKANIICSMYWSVLQNKCTRYWPDCEDNKTYDKVHVLNLKETANPHYILREFLIHHEEEVGRLGGTGVT